MNYKCYIFFMFLLFLGISVDADYIWHKDEIPYSPNARCFRGTSYYTNNPNPSDSTLSKQVKNKSQLDYDNSICYYCVCSTNGYSAGCIARSSWFCDYFRIIRRPNSARDRYRLLFGEDRPAYFRQLSFRLRRTMDDGLIELLNYGGDALCCSHPSGHRRNLHEGVRKKIRLLRKKIPKENILAGSPNGDYVDFVVNND